MKQKVKDYSQPSIEAKGSIWAIPDRKMLRDGEAIWYTYSVSE